MENKLQRGAQIVVQTWMHVRAGESVLIITGENHLAEMDQVRICAEALGARVTVQLVPAESNHLSEYFETLSDLMLHHDVIIGATPYSLVTTQVVRRAVQNGSRFLSLPLATNDGRSLLEYDLMHMDPHKSRFVAKSLLDHINQSAFLRVETEAGTRFTFRKQGRKGSYFNGMAKDGRGFASSSFEVYVPIEEDRTEGLGVVDGSLGYLGKVREPFRIRIQGGRIAEIQQNADGKRLQAYMDAFGDDRIYHASEFGIGLNFFAKCDGNCYIEDESAYGTFHIGFGRNIALGGEFEADGHFDLVFRDPNIYADNRMIMERGVIVPAFTQIL